MHRTKSSVIALTLISLIFTLTGCNTQPLPGGTRVQVKVSAPFKLLTPFISNMVGNPLTVSGTYDVVVQGA